MTDHAYSIRCIIKDNATLKNNQQISDLDEVLPPIAFVRLTDGVSRGFWCHEFYDLISEHLQDVAMMQPYIFSWGNDGKELSMNTLICSYENSNELWPAIFQI